MQRVVHYSGHHLWRVTLAAGKIGTANVADKERVASQYFLRLVGNFGVGNEHGNTFRRMARSGKHVEIDFADFDFLTVSHSMMWKGCARLFSKYDFCSGACRQLTMAA